MKRIHDSLQQVFLRHRLVFWYDATGEWQQTYETFSDPSVTKLTVVNNEFATKVRIAGEPDTRFLVYLPTAQPPDSENWLLDLLYQAFPYKADRASLALQEVGLSHDFRGMAEEHAAFFSTPLHVQAFKDLLRPEDGVRELRLKMMAVLAGTAAEVDALLLAFLSRAQPRSASGTVNPVTQCLGPAALETYFWREVERLFAYVSPEPSLRDFAVSLFRGANPLDRNVSLHPHGRVFLQRWKYSHPHQEAYRNWSHQLELDLQVETALAGADERFQLGDCDTFEIFDKFALRRLCDLFAKGTPPATLRAGVQQRKGSFWKDKYGNGYAALEHATELRELMSNSNLTPGSFAEGFKAYTKQWWLIDKAYRRCHWHLRSFKEVNAMQHVSDWIERHYVNNYLRPLTDRWSDLVRNMTAWDDEALTPQRKFYTHYIEPYLTKGQKVFVIISDAFRYEAAMEFAQRLLSANRWTAEVDALLGSLPSYTQLGMGSLLPGDTRSVDGSKAEVEVNDHSATGLPARRDILARATGGKGTALTAEEFMKLNTKTDGRDLMKAHDVIYIYHNVVDKTGDAVGTEDKTFDAVEDAFAELDDMIRKIANINGTNMVLTADHGFMFQQSGVGDDDIIAFPTPAEVTFRNRRFALGRNFAPTSGVKVFPRAALGLSGDWEAAAFPLSLGRFPLQGSGKRYVHGGTSLQEVVIPVVKIRKARTDDVEQIEVEIIRVPAKVTTGSLVVSLYQDKPAREKTLPRSLKVTLCAQDGTPLSESKNVVFDSKEEEPRKREMTVTLSLAHSADRYNNQEVELRLEEVVSGTKHLVVYKSHPLKIQKPISSDFDTF